MSIRLSFPIYYFTFLFLFHIFITIFHFFISFFTISILPLFYIHPPSPSYRRRRQVATASAKSSLLLSPPSRHRILFQPLSPHPPLNHRLILFQAITASTFFFKSPPSLPSPSSPHSLISLSSLPPSLISSPPPLRHLSLPPIRHSSLPPLRHSSSPPLPSLDPATTVKWVGWDLGFRFLFFFNNKFGELESRPIFLKKTFGSSKIARCLLFEPDSACISVFLLNQTAL